ncbi:MAG: hypothetical protein QOG99_3700 [Frankiales bacterium]|nr:hypothetical protein [Frankiales bacterium]
MRTLPGAVQPNRGRPVDPRPVRALTRVKRTCLAVVLVLAGGCTQPAHRPPKPVAHERPVAAALTAFGNCDALTAALRKEAVKEVGADGLPVPYSRNDGRVYQLVDTLGQRSSLVKAVQGGTVPHSGTTLQEADVDEPDSVKTDGSVMVVSTGSAATLEVLDVTRARPVRLGSLLLHLNRAQLLLDGDRVVALGQVYRGGRVVTVVEIVDISDPTTPTAVRRFRLDGSLLDGRACCTVGSSWRSAPPRGSASRIRPTAPRRSRPVPSPPTAPWHDAPPSTTCCPR